MNALNLAISVFMDRLVRYWAKIFCLSSRILRGCDENTYNTKEMNENSYLKGIAPCDVVPLMHLDSRQSQNT
jgi:hypothetical protein